MSCLTCPSCPDLVVLSQKSYPTVQPRLFLHDCPIHAVMFWTSCPLFPILNFFYPDSSCLIRLSCSGCPVPAFLSRLTCTVCPVPAVLLCQLSFRFCHVLACPFSVQSRIICSADLSGQPVQIDLSRLSCPSGPVQNARSCCSCPAGPITPPPAVQPCYYVLAVLSSLSYPGYPVLISNLGCPDSDILPHRSCPSCPARAFFSPAHCPHCPVLAVTSWPSCPFCPV